MARALKTPSPRKNLVLFSDTGGVRRDKAGRNPARITPRFLEGVFSATGAALLLAGAATTSFAADDAASETAAAVDSATPPKHWPPPIQTLSPSAPLNRKSSVGIGLVHRWQERGVMPTMGQRGEVRFIFGATQDTVVCAPLRVCDITLQAGEIVRNVNIGDPVEWGCLPGISGSGEAETTHIICKPIDAGLETTLAVQTNRRTYSISLVSTRKNYMPIVSWSYPEDQATQWAAYQLHAGNGGGGSAIPSDGYIRYTLSGDSPPWHPIVAYSDGKKTYIQFPPSMAYGKAPVLERIP